MWHKNNEKDLVITSDNTVSNGLFRPGSTAQCGIEVTGPRCRVTGVLFGTGGGASYSDVAVVLDTAAQVAIENNNFHLVGTAAKVTDGAASNKLFSFSNNTINADMPVFTQDSTLTLFTSTINNNRALIAYDPTTDGAVYQVVELPEADSSSATIRSTGTEARPPVGIISTPAMPTTRSSKTIGRIVYRGRPSQGPLPRTRITLRRKKRQSKGESLISVCYEYLPEGF